MPFLYPVPGLRYFREYSFSDMFKFVSTDVKLQFSPFMTVVVPKKCLYQPCS